jgi:hypothetical protein
MRSRCTLFHEKRMSFEGGEEETKLCCLRGRKSLPCTNSFVISLPSLMSSSALLQTLHWDFFYDLIGISTIFLHYLEVGCRSPPITCLFGGCRVQGPPMGPQFATILVHPWDHELAKIETRPFPVFSGVLQGRDAFVLVYLFLDTKRAWRLARRVTRFSWSRVHLHL